MSDKIEWRLRISARARYAKLQIKPYGGLEVVIPPRFPRREIPRLVAQHESWIRRQLEKQLNLRESVRLPETIHLAFDGSTTNVDYGAETTGLMQDLFAVDSGLQITSCDYDGRRRELRAWIRNRAWVLFPPLLRELSRRTALEYRRLTIRSQKTRWGSCSARGSISLNDQLLFVPRETVEYLMIHELCHSRYLNHSKPYWQLVARHCPDYTEHEALLSQPRELVPDWFMLDLYS